MHIARPRRPRRWINLTPLIDVVFLLLIFFMLATSYLDARTVAVSVPPLGTGTASIEGAFMIRIKQDGELELNGSPITLEQLKRRIETQVGARPDQNIQVFPDPSVPLQRVMTVLDRVAAAGALTVTLERPEALK